MATLTDEQNDTCVLHLGTATARSAVASMEELGVTDNLDLPQWSKIVHNVLEQFDLDRDLGGHVVARLWGLASYRGFIAVLLTRHPSNMIQYNVASDERAIVGFAFEGTDQVPDPDSLVLQRSDKKVQSDGRERERAVTFLLSQCDKGDGIHENDQRLVYAAACCSIVDEQLASTRIQAQRALEHLAVKSGADLSEEISKCEGHPSTISSKSLDQFAQPGGHLFEKCEICDAGIPWVSSMEAQCESGHLFGMQGIPQ